MSDPQIRPALSRRLVALVLATSSWVSVAQVAGAQTSGGATRLPIIPLTTIAPDGSGYLADPQPVHLAPSADDQRLLISGTTKAVMSCAEPITPRCFRWTPLTVDAAPLRAAIMNAHARITNYQNIDVFQDDQGRWHAAVTIGVQTPAHQAHWTVVTHAHPVGPTMPGVVPLAWSADTVLAGSFDVPVQGNYDAKYYVDGGSLYLLYVRNYVPEPALRNEIVIQPMSSPERPAAGGPVVLLTPGDRYGALSSEWYANTPAKLVEAPFISRVGGKYALVYSTGAYLTAGYKAAVAWSDTLLPAQGRHYRKVLEPDPQHIWATPSGIEVHYLLQSEKPRWPNFTGGQVIAPGVASAIEASDGAWWLVFNAFAPGDMPVGSNGQVEGPHRRPYAMRLTLAAPAGASVADATDAELARWMTPASR